MALIKNLWTVAGLVCSLEIFVFVKVLQMMTNIAGSYSKLSGSVDQIVEVWFADVLYQGLRREYMLQRRRNTVA